MSIAAMSLTLAAASSLHAQRTPFVGAVTTYVYDGCIDIRSCHRLTIAVGEIVPFTHAGRPVTLGMQYMLEHWFEQRGGSSRPVGPINRPEGAPAGIWIGPGGPWEDADLVNRCWDVILASCIGYVSDAVFWSEGPFGVYAGYAPNATYPIFEVYRGENFTIAGSGTGTLTLTSIVTVTPEPATFVLLAVGIVAIGASRGRSRKRDRTD